MIIKTLETYRCEHCRKLFVQKPAAERHEDRCKRNPDNFRPCFACEHLTKVNANLIDEDRGIETLRCRKRNVFLYTPINQKKGRIYDVGEDSEAMPVGCDQFKQLEF